MLKKRGHIKENFLNEPFECPARDASTNYQPKSPEASLATAIAADLHKIQQEKDNEISTLKRKLSDEKDQQKDKLKKLCKQHKLETNRIKSQSSKLRMKAAVSKQREKTSKIYLQREKNKVMKMRKQCSEAQTVSSNYVKKLETIRRENRRLEKENETLKMKITNLNEQLDDKESTVCKLKTDLHELDPSCQYLETLLHDNEKLVVFDTDSNSYTPEFRQTVMKLISLNVATCNVNDVINTSLNLVGKHLENCPSRKTVDTIVYEKVAISGAQVGEMLQGGKNTTLYSDETKKIGKTYNTFLITDENKNVYCLGFRDMCNKSSRTTLETFKEILSDISEVCSEDTENIGNKILCNLKNFVR